MREYKRIIPCIFISQGRAVKWFDNLEVLSEDVVTLAKAYRESGAAELLVFDLSKTDEEQEHTIELMKKINRMVQIPMIAGGNIKREEDAKKILCTGAQKLILNLSKPEGAELLATVSNRFGKEKLVVSLDDFDTLFKQLQGIETYASEILFMHRPDLDSVGNVTNIPTVILTDVMEEEEIIRILKCPAIIGVSGKFVSQENLNLRTFEETCKSYGIAIAHATEAIMLEESNEMHGSSLYVLENIYQKIQDRRRHPQEGSYTAYLLEQGLDKILKKIGEEATELVIAGKNENADEIKLEISDILYYIMILMEDRGITWDDVMKELSTR